MCQCILPFFTSQSLSFDTVLSVYFNQHWKWHIWYLSNHTYMTVLPDLTHLLILIAIEITYIDIDLCPNLKEILWNDVSLILMPIWMKIFKIINGFQCINKIIGRWKKAFIVTFWWNEYWMTWHGPIRPVAALVQ